MKLPKELEDRMRKVTDALGDGEVPPDKLTAVAMVMIGVPLAKKYCSPSDMAQMADLIQGYLGVGKRLVQFPGMGEMVEERTTIEAAAPRLEIILQCPVCETQAKGLALIGADPNAPVPEGTPAVCLTCTSILVVESRQLRLAILGDQPGKIIEAAHLLLGASFQ